MSEEEKDTKKEYVKNLNSSENIAKGKVQSLRDAIQPFSRGYTGSISADFPTGFSLGPEFPFAISLIPKVFLVPVLGAILFWKVRTSAEYRKAEDRPQLSQT